MMDDNLAGSGATITEVASVSASCAVLGFGLSLPPPRTPAHRPKARALGGDPSRFAPLLTLPLSPSPSPFFRLRCLQGEIAMEGWLKKRGAQVKNVKKRYFMCTRVRGRDTIDTALFRP